jgi:hypothetical protein
MSPRPSSENAAGATAVQVQIVTDLTPTTANARSETTPNSNNTWAVSTSHSSPNNTWGVPTTNTHRTRTTRTTARTKQTRTHALPLSSNAVPINGTKSKYTGGSPPSTNSKNAIRRNPSANPTSTANTNRISSALAIYANARI